MRKASPLARVDAMFEKLQEKLPDQPEFILCVLPERKISDLYGMLLPVSFFLILLVYPSNSCMSWFVLFYVGPWKMRSLSTFGLVTQCVCPVKITERYLMNVLLKINSKVSLNWNHRREFFAYENLICL